MIELRNKTDAEFSYYIDERFYFFKPGEVKKILFEDGRKLMSKFADILEIERSQIATIIKKEGRIIFVLKDGRKLEIGSNVQLEKIKNSLDREKIKIGIFMKNVDHYSGGRYWAWLLGHILNKDKNFQVVFVTNRKPDFGNSFKVFKNKPQIYISKETNLYRMGNEIKENLFDLVIGVPVEGGVSAVSYAKRFQIPSILLIFESPNWIRRYRGGLDSTDGFWHDYRLAMLDCDLVLSNSKIGMEFLNEWIGEKDFKKKSFYLNNTINLDVLNKAKAKEIKTDAEVKFLFVGRLVEHKNIQRLIETLDSLKRKIWFGIISSVGRNLINSWSSRLKFKKSKLELKFFESVDDWEKFSLLKSVDCLLFPSSFEGFGLPPAEALICGKPVIAFDLPILKHIYGKNLIYAKLNDWNDLEKKIEKFIKLSGDYKTPLVINSSEIEKQFSHKNTIKEFKSILEKFLGFGFNKKIKSVSVLKKIKKNSFGMIVYNGEKFIWQNLENIYDIADEIIIVEGAVQSMFEITNSLQSTDKTFELISDFILQKDRIQKIKVVRAKDLNRPFKNKIEMQNILLENLKGSFYIKVDVDEFYEVDKLEEDLRTLEKSNKLMMQYHFVHYWGDFNHRIVGQNFNDKPVRIWKFHKDLVYKGTFNILYDKKKKEFLSLEKPIALESLGKIHHLGYLFDYSFRKEILEYYLKRGTKENLKVRECWLKKLIPSEIDGRFIEPTQAPEFLRRLFKWN